MDNNRTANEDVSYIIQRYIGDASEVHQRYYEAKHKKREGCNVQPSFFVWAR